MARTWPSPRRRRPVFVGPSRCGSRGTIRSRLFALIGRGLISCSILRYSRPRIGWPSKVPSPSYISERVRVDMCKCATAVMWCVGLPNPGPSRIKAENHPLVSFASDSQDRANYRSPEQQWPSRYHVFSSPS